MPTATAKRLYFESWAADYGSPYLVEDDQAETDPAGLAEPDEPFAREPRGDLPTRIAFVDGVRRVEGLVHLSTDDGSLTRGLAGAHARGAVRCDKGQSPAYDGARVERLLIMGSGERVELLESCGVRWRPVSVDASDPNALVSQLQADMRASEAALALDLARDGVLVLLDGPLNLVSAMPDSNLAGIVKTHLRPHLPADLHARIPELPVAHRTPLFLVSHGRSRQCYSAYARIAAPPPFASPWSGIVRVEVPQEAGLEAASERADQITMLLPRYASKPHKDPRAPQNLVPIGQLEHRLRHMLGDLRLAERALRRAVKHTMTEDAL